MIQNDKQVEITKKAINAFKKAIEETKALNAPEIAKKLFLDSYTSQIEDLEAQLSEYEKLKK